MSDQLSMPRMFEALLEGIEHSKDILSEEKSKYSIFVTFRDHKEPYSDVEKQVRWAKGKIKNASIYDDEHGHPYIEDTGDDTIATVVTDDKNVVDFINKSGLSFHDLVELVNDSNGILKYSNHNELKEMIEGLSEEKNLNEERLDSSEIDEISKAVEASIDNMMQSIYDLLSKKYSAEMITKIVDQLKKDLKNTSIRSLKSVNI